MSRLGHCRARFLPVTSYSFQCRCQLRPATMFVPKHTHPFVSFVFILSGPKKLLKFLEHRCDPCNSVMGQWPLLNMFRNESAADLQSA